MVTHGVIQFLRKKALRRIFGVKKDDVTNKPHSKSISQYLLFMQYCYDKSLW
jgi:hypothetical protein